MATQPRPIARADAELSGRNLYRLYKGFCLFRRRCASAAGEAVDRELEHAGRREPLHDICLSGFVDIDWAGTGRVGETGHSDELIGRSGLPRQTKRNAAQRYGRLRNTQCFRLSADELREGVSR